jgi:hypothetical protein
VEELFEAKWPGEEIEGDAQEEEEEKAKRRWIGWWVQKG